MTVCKHFHPGGELSLPPPLQAGLRAECCVFRDEGGRVPRVSLASPHPARRSRLVAGRRTLWGMGPPGTQWVRFKSSKGSSGPSRQGQGHHWADASSRLLQTPPSQHSVTPESQPVAVTHRPLSATRASLGGPAGGGFQGQTNSPPLRDWTSEKECHGSSGQQNSDLKCRAWPSQKTEGQWALHQVTGKARAAGPAPPPPRARESPLPAAEGPGGLGRQAGATSLH